MESNLSTKWKDRGKQRTKATAKHPYKTCFQISKSTSKFITNTTINQEHIIQFHSFNQLPRKGRKILNIDKMQLTTIRVKTKGILNI